MAGVSANKLMKFLKLRKFRVQNFNIYKEYIYEFRA
jgi:hypothetical protein